MVARGGRGAALVGCAAAALAAGCAAAAAAAELGAPHAGHGLGGAGSAGALRAAADAEAVELALQVAAKIAPYIRADLDEEDAESAELGPNLLAEMLSRSLEEVEVEAVEEVGAEEGEGGADGGGGAKEDETNVEASGPLALTLPSWEDSVETSLALAKKQMAKAKKFWDVYGVPPLIPTAMFLRDRWSLGGGRCKASYHSEKKWMFFPKLTSFDCSYTDKASKKQIHASYQVCVRFKIYMKMEHDICLTPENWNLLMTGQIIRVNPESGALVINAMNVLNALQGRTASNQAAMSGLGSWMPFA